MNATAANGLILKVPEQGDEFPLQQGLQAIHRDTAGLHVGNDDADALARVCVDRRGTWLTVGSGNVHVNGRRVRRMAIPRAGDAVFVDGSELLLADIDRPEAPQPGLLSAQGEATSDLRVLLRGVGGSYHGRSITLDRPRLIGSADGADIRIDDPAFPQRHSQLLYQDGHVLLRDLGSQRPSTLNGHVVSDAVLHTGDQLVFDAMHRFVVESPGRALGNAMPPLDFSLATDDASGSAGSSWRRWPWLLLSALLIAALLGALLFWGSPA